VKKLLLTTVLAFALLAAIPAVSLGGKGGIGTEDTCAASFGVENASACGGGPITWYFYGRYPRGAFADCYYEGRMSNGTVSHYLVRTVTQFQSCPSQP
jgi:hypothetical protein